MTKTDLPTPCFIARPSGAPRGGVVVVMEGNGIGWQLLRVCERLAAEGYVAVAPDVYHRLHTGDGDWESAFSTLSHEEALEDIRAAVAIARENGARKVGITGFCMGGRLSYLAATSDVDIQAAVPFYGGGVDGILGDAHCPLLAFFGGQDEYVPKTAIEKVQARHGDDIVVYDDAQHGFMRDGSPEFHATAAPEAWQRALAFFATHLA
jgi:carboxymethylenebutenolidase